MPKDVTVADVIDTSIECIDSVTEAVDVKDVDKASNPNAKKYLFPMRSDPKNYGRVTLVEVDEAFYKAISPEIWRTWKYMRYWERCCCPNKKRCLCDGQCDLCYYRVPSDELSLDAPTKADISVSVGQTIIDPSPSPEDLICDCEELTLLSQAIDELTEDDKLVCHALMHSKSERDAAGKSGIPRSTYKRKLAKVKTELKNTLCS